MVYYAGNLGEIDLVLFALRASHYPATNPQPATLRESKTQAPSTRTTSAIKRSVVPYHMKIRMNNKNKY
jgi:hypothetical protein